MALASNTFAQPAEPWHLPRAHEPIVLDGKPDEEAWQEVEPVPVVQYEPDAGEPATEETEFLFMYDDEYFYAAVRAYDDNPDGIRSNTLYRDGLSGDDHFEFMLDTYNDDETGVIFTTTPAGLRREAAISNDASGGGIASGSWLNVDYNTYWSVETVVNDEGWFAEMRIPLSSLRFQEQNGRVTMGLIVQRKIARRGERVVFPAVKPDANYAFLKPSRAHHIVLEDVESERPVHVTPYGLGGFERVSALNEDESRYVMQDDFQQDVGLDVKYRMSNLSMDLTVNTDFAQVEADNEQINLSRFSLFFPEKRRFFQERAGLFEFRTGGRSRLFHSRRIGITEDGQPVRILGGARVVGRIDDWDVGVMDMQTKSTSGLPSENFGVLRMRRKVLNPYSYTGGLFTSRVGMDGTYNVTYGLDGLFRVVGDDYLSVKWAQTINDVLVNNDLLTPINSGRLALEFERRRRQGVGFDFFLTRSGPFYDPGMGFTRRDDFLNLDNTLSYTWMPGVGSDLIWHTLAVNGYGFLRNEEGTVESAALETSWDFTARTQASGGALARLQYEDILAPFSLSESTHIPAGSYSFATVQANYQTPYTDLVDTGAQVEAGTFYDGWQVSAQLTPSWSLSKHFELEGTYEYHRIRFPDRNQKYETHLARLRIRAALNTQISLNTFVQYNGTAERFSANTRFRYNFREGNDLWLVYNEALRTDRHTALPSGIPLTDTRTVLAKYTYTLHF